jgi:hypothetical protein
MRICLGLIVETLSTFNDVRNDVKELLGKVVGVLRWVRLDTLAVKVLLPRHMCSWRVTSNMFLGKILTRIDSGKLAIVL